SVNVRDLTSQEGRSSNFPFRPGDFWLDSTQQHVLCQGTSSTRSYHSRSPRGHHGTSRWIYWTRDHGPPHGQELAQGGLSTSCPQPEPGAGPGTGRGRSQGGQLTERCGLPGGGPHHHASELSRRRDGGARQERHHRGSETWTPLPRYVDHFTPRVSEGGQGAPVQGRADAGCAGVGRGEGRHRGSALDHGRRGEVRFRRRAA